MRSQRCLAAIALVAVMLAPAVASTQAVSTGDLSRLVEAQGVSGFETDVRDAIRALLPTAVHARVDEIGNLVATLGQGSPHLLVTTSIDEDGYLVSGITEDGYLRLQRVSTGASHPLFDQFLYGQPVVIRKVDGRKVPGVCMTVSAHLQRGRSTSASPKGLDDLWVDVGARSRAEVAALGVKLLDTVALRERVTPLAGNRVAGVAAQARAGALALVQLVRLLAAHKEPFGSVTIAWTSQGVFGDRGFARLAREMEPDRVLIVARAAVGREVDATGIVGAPGSGAFVFQGSGPGPQASRLAGLPPSWTAKTKVVGLPVQFAQTPVETVALDDVASLVRLLATEAGVQGAEVSATPAPGQAATHGPPPAAGGPDTLSEIFRALQPLVESYGVSGHETPVRDAVARQLPAWAKPEVDARGNLTLSFGKGGQEILFVAHTDELGYEITDIRDDGTASVRRGGVFNSAMEAHPVVVHTRRGQVAAVVAPRPNYLRAAEWQPKADEVRLYFGTDSRAATEALGVARGDTATVGKRFVPLAGSRATARSLDDRAGCAALTVALRKIDPSKVRNRVTFAWDVEEETGLVGAGVLADRMHPAYVFAVDTFVSSDTPIDPHRMALVPLGSGAVLRAADNSSLTPPELVAEVQTLAAGHRIPVSVGITSGGNDGSQFSKGGARLLPLSWPGRYSHSAVEVLDGRDLEALVNLVVALVNEFPRDAPVSRGDTAASGAADAGVRR